MQHLRQVWTENYNRGQQKSSQLPDVTLNLTNGKYMPYTKPGNIPLYVHKISNHPPRIIENIPKSINRRFSEISFDVDSSNEAALLYQKALDDSGYNHRLTFSPPTVQTSNSARKNQRHYLVQTSF